VPDENSDRYLKRVPSGESSLWRNGGPCLFRIDIELTERCNNACLHCYINRPAGDAGARKREMPAARIAEILKEAAALGCLEVRFTGGEPLLRPDFEEIYLAARRLGMKVSIYTNATLITPHIADLLARIPPLEPVEVTLYGMTPESYEAVTGAPGSYAAAMAGIGRLVEKKIRFIVKGAFLPSNASDLENLEKWAEGIPGMDRVPSVSVFHVLHARGDQEKNRSIRKMRPDPETGTDILTRHPRDYVKGLKEFLENYSGKPGDRLFACGAGEDSCSVDAYGMLQPCLLVRHPAVVYDLGRGSLKEAMTVFFPEIRKKRASNPRYLETCARCPLAGFCEQCPGKAWMEHGEMDAPAEYFCEVTHVQARRLGLLGDGEKTWEVEDWAARVRAFSEAGAAERLESLKKTVKEV
jgi:radical SAM protein with 4Fe4S-binding SPASM domain